MKRTVVAGVALAVVAAIAIVAAMARRGVIDAPRPCPCGTVTEEPVGSADHDATQSEEGAAVANEDERREVNEEKLVDDFDAITGKWTDPAPNGVTMADVDGFTKSFRRLPKNRRDECIHRALNLIPDANVMLLAGVLMDKSMDGKIVEAVFHDVLNRDEDVKKPILREIFRDRAHPCWADAAWILDATGERPEAK